MEITPQTREQLSPPRVGTPLSGKYHQRNVHFRDPEGEVDRKHYTRVHDPIFITPRHPENESLKSKSEIPRRTNSPDGSPDPNGRYFSGTVEHGKGGNFYGYYFTLSQMTDPKIQRRFYSSTPYLERSFGERSVPHRPMRPMTPRRLFPTTQGMHGFDHYGDDRRTHELPERYFEEDFRQGNLKGAPEEVLVPVPMENPPDHRYRLNKLNNSSKIKAGPPIMIPVRDAYRAPMNSRNYNRNWTRISSRKEPPKHKDEEGYPLPQFEEVLGLGIK